MQLKNGSQNINKTHTHTQRHTPTRYQFIHATKKLDLRGVRQHPVIILRRKSSHADRENPCVSIVLGFGGLPGVL
jgi:hypothetical protein